MFVSNSRVEGLTEFMAHRFFYFLSHCGPLSKGPQGSVLLVTAWGSTHNAAALIQAVCEHTKSCQA